MMRPMAVEGREARLEDSVIRAKKLCDLCSKTDNGEEKNHLMMQSINSLTEISYNPAQFYLVSNMEYPMLLQGMSEKEIKDRSKRILDAITEQKIEAFYRHFLQALDLCGEDCAKSREHLDAMYKEVMELIDGKCLQLVRSLEIVKKSEAKLESILEAQVSQIKYLQTLMGKPGM